MNDQLKIECGGCAYFNPTPTMIGFGTCMALPPIPVLITQRGQQGFTNVRPQMSASDGCSLFRPRIVPVMQIPPLES